MSSFYCGRKCHEVSAYKQRQQVQPEVAENPQINRDGAGKGHRQVGRDRFGFWGPTSRWQQGLLEMVSVCQLSFVYTLMCDALAFAPPSLQEGVCSLEVHVLIFFSSDFFLFFFPFQFWVNPKSFVRG